jgi:hypothetical protein
MRRRRTNPTHSAAIAQRDGATNGRAQIRLDLRGDSQDRGGRISISGALVRTALSMPNVVRMRRTCFGWTAARPPSGHGSRRPGTQSSPWSDPRRTARRPRAGGLSGQHRHVDLVLLARRQPLPLPNHACSEHADRPPTGSGTPSLVGYFSTRVTRQSQTQNSAERDVAVRRRLSGAFVRRWRMPGPGGGRDAATVAPVAVPFLGSRSAACTASLPIR